MIAGIASLLFIPLLAVAFAHLLWGFGGKWPMQNREMLARTVIGFKGGTRMPPRLFTLVFGLVAFAAGIVALSLSDPAVGLTTQIVGGLLAVVLLARGIAGYTPKWRAWRPEQPFSAMDRKYYSPLALYLGLGFFILTVWRFV
jgi:hypothetical protein